MSSQFFLSSNLKLGSRSLLYPRTTLMVNPLVITHGIIVGQTCGIISFDILYFQNGVAVFVAFLAVFQHFCLRKDNDPITLSLN